MGDTNDKNSNGDKRFSPCSIFSKDSRRSFLLSSHILIIWPLLYSSLILGRFTLVSGLNYTTYRNVSNLRLERIKKYVDRINKPHVLSIQSPDGDIIDCVHRKKQPAFDHPLLKNHKLQEPPEMPKLSKVMMNGKKEGNVKKKKEGTPKAIEWQMWHLNGTRCPKGTIPIRRITVDDVLRAKSLYDFGKKQPHQSQRRPLAGSIDAPNGAPYSGHEYATVSTPSSEGIYYGTKATINVWDPSVEEMNEFSLSQLWIVSGGYQGSDLNTIEAGWQVSQGIYGDTRPRLFIYWTRDAYKSTGCYNLRCAGFVQTDSRIAIGGAIAPISSFSGQQSDITILIWKDPKQGNWWMNVEGITVGYWPAKLFTGLANHATTVQWGGEVVNTQPNGHHTSTQMGSGHFAESGFRKASYFRNLEIVGSDNNLSPAQFDQIDAEHRNCYDLRTSFNNDWGQHFYYGGPGRNANCP